MLQLFLISTLNLNKDEKVYIMSKKGFVVALTVAAAFVLGGCAEQNQSATQPMPQTTASQSGYSGKLGKMGAYNGSSKLSSGQASGSTNS